MFLSDGQGQTGSYISSGKGVKELLGGSAGAVGSNNGMRWLWWMWIGKGSAQETCIDVCLAADLGRIGTSCSRTHDNKTLPLITTTEQGIVKMVQHGSLSSDLFRVNAHRGRGEAKDAHSLHI